MRIIVFYFYFRDLTHVVQEKCYVSLLYKPIEAFYTVNEIGDESLLQ